MRIRRCHWLQVARDCGIDRAERILDDLTEACPAVLDRVAGSLPESFPPAVSAPILEGVADAARRLGSD